jgi:hypothetical protein
MKNILSMALIAGLLLIGGVASAQILDNNGLFNNQATGTTNATGTGTINATGTTATTTTGTTSTTTPGLPSTGAGGNMLGYMAIILFALSVLVSGGLALSRKNE